MRRKHSRSTRATATSIASQKSAAPDASYVGPSSKPAPPPSRDRIERRGRVLDCSTLAQAEQELAQILDDYAPSRVGVLPRHRGEVQIYRRALEAQAKLDTVRQLVEFGNVEDALDAAFEFGLMMQLVILPDIGGLALTGQDYVKRTSEGGRKSAARRRPEVKPAEIYDALEGARRDFPDVTDRARLRKIAPRFKYGERGEERIYDADTLYRKLVKAGYLVGRNKKAD